MSIINRLAKTSIFFLVLITLQSHAAVITYKATALGGNGFSYDYVVIPEAGDPLIQEFTIFFDSTLYNNLSIIASPSGWDSILIPPDAALDADGFFDSLYLPGLALGELKRGFGVSFVYLGAGMPGAQRFDIVDPDTFTTISTGTTTAAVTGPVDIPEPSSLSLGLFSLLIPVFLRRKHLWRTV